MVFDLASGICVRAEPPSNLNPGQDTTANLKRNDKRRGRDNSDPVRPSSVPNLNRSDRTHPSTAEVVHSASDVHPAGAAPRGEPGSAENGSLTDEEDTAEVEDDGARDGCFPAWTRAGRGEEEEAAE